MTDEELQQVKDRLTQGEPKQVELAYDFVTRFALTGSFLDQVLSTLATPKDKA